MMNAVALFLVLSSLVTAGVWSPPPEKLKEDNKCYSNIPPPPTTTAKEELSSSTTHVTEGNSAEVDQDFKNKLKEALDKCRDRAREVEERAKEKGTGVFEALTKAKETVSQEAKDKVLEKAQGGKEVVRDATEKAKETVSDATQKAKEKVLEKAQEVKDTVGDATQKAKERVTEKLGVDNRHEEERAAEKMAGRAEQGVKTMGNDGERNLATKIESGEEKAEQGSGSETAEQQAAEGTANHVMEGGGEKDLNEIFRRGREVGYDVLVYVVSPKAVELAVGVVHLLGFAAAYGMCLWVTFVSSYVLGGALNRQQFGVVQSKIYPVYFRTMAYCVALALVAHLLSHRKRVGLGNHMGTVEVFLGYNLLASLLMILFNLLYLEPRATKVMFDRMKLEKEEGRGRDSSISEPSSKAAADPSSDSAAIPVHGADATSAPPVMPEQVMFDRTKLEKEEGRRRDSSISEPSSKAAADPSSDSAAIPVHGADATSAPPVMPERVAVMSQIVKLSERLKKLNAYSSFLNILTLMLLTWHLVYLGQHLHVTC